MSPYARLMKKVEKQPDENEDGGCWLFTGALDQNGHGNVRVFRNGRWSCAKVHRVVYETIIGEIPDGHVVRHRCDVRNCVRPSHLTTGTQQQNVDDMIERGRAWFQQKSVKDKAYEECPF